MEFSKENNGEAIIAFSEWLEDKGYSYALFMCKDEECGILSNGEPEQVVAALASGMIEHPRLLELVTTAVATAVGAMNDDVDDKLNGINFN